MDNSRIALNRSPKAVESSLIACTEQPYPIVLREQSAFHVSKQLESEGCFEPKANPFGCLFFGVEIPKTGWFSFRFSLKPWAPSKKMRPFGEFP